MRKRKQPTICVGLICLFYEIAITSRWPISSLVWIINWPRFKTSSQTHAKEEA